ncbi:MAG: hypothetical protein J6Q73_03850 [Bacteroidaceae bacterium]|nr:hypothetical protein [Bacteroidaceae bacterium]
MNNAFIKDELQRLYDEKLRKKQERQRNAAAIANFASNLISVLGYSGVPSISSPQKGRNNPFQKYNGTMRDFKGSIASGMFRTRFSPTAMWGMPTNNSINKTFKFR